MFVEKFQSLDYGIGTYVREVLGIFRNLPGYVFNVIYMGVSEEEFRIEKEDNITKYYVPNLYERYMKDNDAIYFRNLWYLLYSYMEEYCKYDSIFILNYYKDSCFIDYIRKYFVRSKIYFVIHYQTWCFLLKGNETYFRRILNMGSQNVLDERVLNTYRLEKNVYDCVDHVIALSVYTKELLIELYGVDRNKISVIYNGMNNCVKKMSDSEKLKCRHELYIEDVENVILFVGRLDAIKGIDILINAFDKLLSIDSNYRLLIAGNGNYEEFLPLTRTLSSKINFLGFLKQSELEKIYEIADIGIMLSFHEQCSYVAIEFMKHGVPLIISTSTGLNEMIDGVKVQVRNKDNISIIDIDDIVNSIITISKDVNKIKYSSLSYKTYENKYTQLLMKNRMLDIFTGI